VLNICHVVFPEWLETSERGREQTLLSLWDGVRLGVCMKRVKDGVIVVDTTRTIKKTCDKPTPILSRYTTRGDHTLMRTNIAPLISFIPQPDLPQCINLQRANVGDPSGETNGCIYLADTDSEYGHCLEQELLHEDSADTICRKLLQQKQVPL
jgi:hypothetical protein